MGTSSSNPGPGGPPPLLPPWAGGGSGGGDDGSDHNGPDDGGDGAGDGGNGGDGSDGPGDGDVGDGGPGGAPPGGSPPEPVAPLGGRPTWPSARRQIGAAGSGGAGRGGGRDNVRSGVRSAVGAMGGAGRAAGASPAGRRTAGRFAGFLASVATTGVAAAARDLGIAEFLGRSADVFLLRLSDALAPAGALTEDAIARDAMDDTLLELYQRLDFTADGALVLERMTPAMMAEMVVRYVVNYVYTRVIHALTAHIHAKSHAVTRMREIEQTARHYIEDAVRLDIDTTVFFGEEGAALAGRWDAGEGQSVIDRLFEESYSVVEAGLHHGDRGAA